MYIVQNVINNIYLLRTNMKNNNKDKDNKINMKNIIIKLKNKVYIFIIFFIDCMQDRNNITKQQNNNNLTPLKS
jgi:hypothetical protein